MGLESVLSRGLEGLTVGLRGMGVTSNNVANANTPGYAKEAITVSATNIGSALPGNGGGVEVTGLQAIINPFLEMQLAQTTNAFGTLDGRTQTVQQIESLWNESQKTGLGPALKSFFGSFKTLAQDPSDAGARGEVIQAGTNLATQFNSLEASFNSMRASSSSSIQTKLSTINSMTANIAQLNQAIVNAGGDANVPDLVSQRISAVKDLSQEIGVTYFEKTNGALEIQSANGGTLVLDNAAGTLSMSDNLGAGGKAAVICTSPGSGTAIDITSGVTTGRLGGMLFDRNTTLNQQVSNLDTLASQLVQQFNTAHAAGYGQDGTNNNNFFSPLASSTSAASLIAVSQTILNNPNKIAAAANDPTNSPGDGINATNLFNLSTTKLLNTNTQTFSDYYAQMVGDIGSVSADVQTKWTNAEHLVTKAQLQREATSGVNMDEEGANIIRYQKAFQASSKIISVADELLDTILKI